MDILVNTVERQKEGLKKIGAGRNTIILSRNDISFGEKVMRIAKRTVDLLFSLLFLIVFFPVVVPVVFFILKFSSKGPLFFIQERIGKDGKIFRCFKFRTMHVNDDADTRQCSENDERIFPMGKFLRATHLDELPQLVNVLMGDMSLVGPRPHMVYHDELFATIVPEYALRRQVRPGLTGLAQVKGCHGPTPDKESIRRRTRFDLHYVRNMSAGMDLVIFARTVGQVISGRSSSC